MQESLLTISISDRIINLLGYELIDLLLNCTKLTLYDINDVRENTNNTVTSTHFCGYRINSIKPEPASSTIKDLKNIFLGLTTYQWDGAATACVFQPGFALSFGNMNDKHLINIFICFKCSEILFQWDNGVKSIKKSFCALSILLIVLEEEFNDCKKIEEIREQFSIF